MLERLSSQTRMAAGLASSIAANQMGRVTAPRIGYFLVTWKCNLRCVMCNVWKEDRYPHLGTDDMRAMFRRVPFLDVVKIGGGEPFLRDDMVEIVREIQTVIRPHHLIVISNATTRDRLVDFVKACGRPGLQLRISIEGRGETHDRLRGRTGCFEKSMDTLEALLALKRAKGFSIAINYNITPETAADLPWVRELCRREGMDLLPGYWVYPFLEPGDPRESRALVDDPVALRGLLDETFEQRHAMNPIESFFVRRTIRRMFDEALDPAGDPGFSCRALRNILYVLPDGQVISCGIKHGSIGNLARQPFDEIWFGPKADEGRRDVDACPGCHQYTMKAMSRVYTGESLGLPPPRRAAVAPSDAVRAPR